MDNQYGPVAALPLSPPRLPDHRGWLAVPTACLQMTPPGRQPPSADVRLPALLLAISDAGSARVGDSDASKLE